MPDRETVFDAIRNCITEPKCRDCPWGECEKFDCKKVSVPVSLMLDALKLLKEKEPKKPEWRVGRAHCSECGELFPKKKENQYIRFCSFCGQAVKWDD